ncbi:hypothetical protein GH5_03060 [Leishmania sp. Ghana 2012 LV757]|uniref:hypothetical protein n=1 Tax=Leishmania sp. Ghana 2012 LV757 TaxID=2803181 RepID=UPI001B7ACF74|nr:hypothetical protein GH5_03060 [Leishmania sp. Ghana 2012 LV757]
MNAMDDLSDDELRTGALNDPGLFLDIEDDDEDVVVSARLPTPAVVLQCQQQLLQRSASSTTAGEEGNGVPKLDVAALSSFPLEPSRNPMTGLIAPGSVISPISFSRDHGQEHTTSSVYIMGTAHSSSQASSPHNTSQSFSSFNVYASIANPPLCARSLAFRDFLNQKSVPLHIENEESTGIFVGQLPSSYAEDDIEALLKAIGHERGKIVQVRDVKCHNRDRTCAFIMINAGALTAILDFTKRVLCDINCVWIVEHNQAAQLPLFIQQMPREQLRGVPKAALVLKKLTPQSKSRHSNHKPSAANSPNAGYPALQNGVMSPMQQNMMSMLSQPVYLQQQGAGVSAAAAPGYLDVSTLQATSPFAASNYIQAASVKGLPQFLGTSRFPPGAPTGTFFSPGGITSCPNPVYAMQVSNSGIANIEVANQMMLAASRSFAELPSHQLNINPSSPSMKEPHAPPPKPITVTLQPALQSEHCSCGQMLFLSQYPEQGTCAKCQSAISPNDIAYWCASGHIAVCTNCAIKSNKSQNGLETAGHRLSTGSKSKRIDPSLTSRAIN